MTLSNTILDAVGSFLSIRKGFFASILENFFEGTLFSSFSSETGGETRKEHRLDPGSIFFNTLNRRRRSVSIVSAFHRETSRKISPIAVCIEKKTFLRREKKKKLSFCMVASLLHNVLQFLKG
jgi:hypothetical protein